jgi:hypothetical protein
VTRDVPIGSLDAMIATHATQLGLIVVTHDVDRFGRVRGLEVVDGVWARGGAAPVRGNHAKPGGPARDQPELTTGDPPRHAAAPSP